MGHKNRTQIITIHSFCGYDMEVREIYGGVSSLYVLNSSKRVDQHVKYFHLDRVFKQKPSRDGGTIRHSQLYFGY